MSVWVVMNSVRWLGHCIVGAQFSLHGLPHKNCLVKVTKATCVHSESLQTPTGHLFLELLYKFFYMGTLGPYFCNRPIRLHFSSISAEFWETDLVYNVHKVNARCEGISVVFRSWQQPSRCWGVTGRPTQPPSIRSNPRITTTSITHTSRDWMWSATVAGCPSHWISTGRSAGSSTVRGTSTTQNAGNHLR